MQQPTGPIFAALWLFILTLPPSFRRKRFALLLLCRQKAAAFCLPSFRPGSQALRFANMLLRNSRGARSFDTKCGQLFWFPFAICSASCSLPFRFRVLRLRGMPALGKSVFFGRLPLCGSPRAQEAASCVVSFFLPPLRSARRYCRLRCGGIGAPLIGLRPCRSAPPLAFAICSASCSALVALPLAGGRAGIPLSCLCFPLALRRRRRACRSGPHSAAGLRGIAAVSQFAPRACPATIAASVALRNLVSLLFILSVFQLQDYSITHNGSKGLASALHPCYRCQCYAFKSLKEKRENFCPICHIIK